MQKSFVILRAAQRRGMRLSLGHEIREDMTAKYFKIKKIHLKPCTSHPVPSA